MCSEADARPATPTDPGPLHDTDSNANPCTTNEAAPNESVSLSTLIQGGQDVCANSIAPSTKKQVKRLELAFVKELKISLCCCSIFAAGQNGSASVPGTTWNSFALRHQIY